MKRLVTRLERPLGLLDYWTVFCAALLATVVLYAVATAA